MPNDILPEIINTLTELRRMHQLNFELLEQLSISCGWLIEHRVSIPNANTLASLLSKAMVLLTEIQGKDPKIIQYQELSDEFLQRKKSDGDLTEPY